MPPVIKISKLDWWVKPVEMLVHNWALIEESQTGTGTVTVYFFHDKGKTKGGGTTRNPYSFADTRHMAAIVDSLEFESIEHAKYALKSNGFRRLTTAPGPWQGSEPEGDFYDARPYEVGIYSKAGYWSSD